MTKVSVLYLLRGRLHVTFIISELYLLGESECSRDVGLPVSHVEQEQAQEDVKHHPVDVFTQLQADGHPKAHKHCNKTS